MLNIRSCAYALYKARWIFEHGGENLIANTYAEYCNALFNEDILSFLKTSTVTRSI